MNIEFDEENLEQIELYQELELSEREVEEGKVVKAGESLASLREKYKIY